MKFSEKVAIVTGASVGVGRATSVELAENGASVVITDIDMQKLGEVEAEIKKITQNVLTVKCDVADEENVKAVVAATLERFGRIDILVNNAGLWRRYMPFEETDSSMWKQYINVNILGTMYFSHEVLATMKAQKYGRIINLTSVAGVYGNANMVDYSMTKGGLIAFTKALAKEVAEYNITVNGVAPGTVSNEYNTYEPNELNYSGRSGLHSENAKLICFLASDDAAYISGQNYQIDGCRKKI